MKNEKTSQKPNNKSDSTTTSTQPSHSNAINFLPISGPGGKGIGVATQSSGTIVGVTFPGSGGKALSKPSVQVTNSTNLDPNGNVKINTAISQPVYPGGNGPKIFAGITFRF